MPVKKKAAIAVKRPKWEYLKTGDLIKRGDQFYRAWDKSWLGTIMDGSRVAPGVKYRREVKKKGIKS